VLWEKPTRTTLGKFPAYLSPAIADDGTIYAGQINYPNIVVLTPSGSQLWARTDLDGAPAIGINGNVYVVPETGILNALSPIDGSTLWTYSTGKTDYYNSEGVTVDASGNLYVSNEQGLLMSLTPEGQLRWSMDLAPNLSGFVGLSAPIISSNGVVYVVGGHTGKVLAIVPEPATCLIVAIGLFSLLWINYPRLARSHLQILIPIETGVTTNAPNAPPMMPSQSDQDSRIPLRALGRFAERARRTQRNQLPPRRSCKSSTTPAASLDSFGLWLITPSISFIARAENPVASAKHSQVPCQTQFPRLVE
jgi:hypothetical protein